MSKIRSKDTKIELQVRLWLHHRNVRYRKNCRTVIGTPDISIKKYKIAIFVNGCFWHGHENCKLGVTPKSHIDFWHDKISKNKERDIRNTELLKLKGWHVFTVWECQLGKEFEETMTKLLDDINCIKTTFRHSKTLH